MHGLLGFLGTCFFLLIKGILFILIGKKAKVMDVYAIDFDVRTVVGGGISGLIIGISLWLFGLLSEDLPIFFLMSTLVGGLTGFIVCTIYEYFERKGKP